MSTAESPAPEGRKWTDVLVCLLSVLGGFCAAVLAFVTGAGFAAYVQLAAARTGFLAVRTGPVAPAPDEDFDPFGLPPDDGDLPFDASPSTEAETGEGPGSGSDPEPTEPARLSYLWAEIWPAAGRAFSAYRDRMTDWPGRALDKCRVILVEKQESLIYVPIFIGCVVGAALAAPVALAMALTGALITAMAFVAGGAASGALWLLLAGADRALTTFRRVLISCPHEAGCARFWHPVYECPAELCRRRHHRLVPNRYGVLRHTCECGTRLPTTVLLGRYRLNAYCPHCNGQLPGRIGAVRLAHLPFVGGPATGKSTLMHLVLDARREAVEQAGGAFQFLDHWDERRLRDGLATLRSKRQLPATQNRLPSAVMVDVQPKTEAGHILYVFDPAGEVYDRMSSMHSQEYLRTSEAQILVVDPFTIPDLRNALGTTDLSAAAELDPSLQNDVPRNSPEHLVDAVLASLLPRLPDTRSRPRIAVVVTKWDALRRTPLEVPADTAPAQVRRWLESWTSIVDTLERANLDVRCFASGLLETPQAHFNSIMDWCLGDLPPGRRRRPWLARLAGGVGRTPWKPRGSGPVPLSYRIWGWALFAGQVLGIVGVGALAYVGLAR